MPDAWVDARRMHADEQFVVPRLRFLDVAKLEHVGRAVLVLNDGFHGCRYFLPLLPSARPPSLQSSRLPTGPSTDCTPSMGEDLLPHLGRSGAKAKDQQQAAVYLSLRAIRRHLDLLIPL